MCYFLLFTSVLQVYRGIDMFQSRDSDIDQ